MSQDSATTNKKLLLRWSLGGLAVLSVARWVGIGLAPTLLNFSPLLWVAMSPVPAHLVVAATLTPMVPFVAVTSLRRVVGSVFLYMLGRAFGDSGIPWVRSRYPRASKLLEPVIRAFEVSGPLVVFAMPLYAVSMLAGATRMRTWTFLPIVSAGHVMWCYLTYRVGTSLSKQIEPITRFMHEHMLGATLAFITFAVVYALIQRRQQRAALQAVLPQPTSPAED